VAPGACSGLRLDLGRAPSTRPGERALPLELHSRTAWLHADDGWDDEALARIAAPLAGLLDVAVERERVGEQAAEAEAARRADVAKTAILHAISHDLRSPLTAISTAASAMEGTFSEDDRRELLAVLRAEADRLERLVADLLDLSRIEAGAVHPQSDWCDLADTVASAAEQVRARQGEHPIELRIDRDLPLVHADPVQIERVFANLIENAVKFSPAGSPVVVTGSAGGGRVTVRVVDHGPGIAAGERKHVFEPFHRGRHAGAGSGLGLAICRGFVEANGGQIRLQAGTGRGTAFAVAFPLAGQPAVAP